MSVKTKITVIGAGSSYTPEVIGKIIDYQHTLKVDEISLLDLEDNLDRLKIIHQYSQRMIEAKNETIRISYTLDRKEALEDATFVLIQIRVGKMEARIFDETIPSLYGLLGHETIGIGGMFNALRTVPVIYEIIEDVKKYAPKAWVINVSNPSGIIAEYVYRFSEFDRFIGISSDPNQATKTLQQKLNASPGEVVPYFAGLNDLSFILKVYHHGKDKLDSLIEEGYSPYKEGMESLIFKDMRLFSHPNLRYYSHHDEMLKAYLDDMKKGSIRAKEVVSIEQQLFEKFKDEKTIDLPKNMDQRLGRNYADTAIGIMDAIKNNTKAYHVINTINRGHILGIPDECAIEITSRMTNRGPIPVHIGELPLQVRGIIQHLKAYEELLCDAIYERDLDKALLAIQTHPLSRSFNQNKVTFKKLVEAHEKHLTYYRKDL